MGQQQLLLIILGVIIVGIAIAVGITMFKDNATSQNRDSISNDLMHLAAKAKHYYKRPSSMGGGGHSFAGLTEADGMALLVTTNFSNNPNGLYTIKSPGGSATQITFQCVGKAPLDDGSFPTLECLVTQSTQSIIIIN